MLMPTEGVHSLTLHPDLVGFRRSPHSSDVVSGEEMGRILQYRHWLSKYRSSTRNTRSCFQIISILCHKFVSHIYIL